MLFDASLFLCLCSVWVLGVGTQEKTGEREKGTEND